MRNGRRGNKKGHEVEDNWGPDNPVDSPAAFRSSAFAQPPASGKRHQSSPLSVPLGTYPHAQLLTHREKRRPPRLELHVETFEPSMVHVYTCAL
jgi:hypothetical protein